MLRFVLTRGLPLAVLAIALLWNFEFMEPVRKVVIDSLTSQSSDSVGKTAVKVKVFTKDELSKFKGVDGGKVYLALLGNVFDVSKGRKHYGLGGGYAFFSGIDGTKAYVTGQFNKEGLVDDISELKPSDVVALDGWKDFYDKDYTFVGYVEGSFYNKDGKELEMMKVFRQKVKLGQKEKELVEQDQKLFPPCNSEWNSERGGRVWCSNQSGGVQREWAGVPRRYFVAGSKNPRCACVRTTGPPSHNPQDTKHKNRGDLDNPNLAPYPNCTPDSESCPLPKD